MSIPMVLLPVFVLVALTFVILFATGGLRTASVKSGEVKMRDVALGQQAWGDRATKLANSFNNQLQLPILFYALVAFAMITRQADLAFVVMSWIFVGTRLVHAYIHIGTNYMPHRFYAFAAGAIVLLLMWVVFAVRILLA